MGFAGIFSEQNPFFWVKAVNEKVLMEKYMLLRQFMVFGLMVALGMGIATAAAEKEDVVDFTLKDLQGKTHKLSDYRGKWVVVNYWATWCPPCLEEIPDLSDFHDKHKDTKAVVLGINTEQLSTSRLSDFSDSYLISYPVLPALNDPLADHMLGPIPALPTTYIVSPNGRVIARNVGPLTGQMIESFMKTACKDKPVEAC